MSKNKKILLMTLAVMLFALILGVFRTYLLVNYIEQETGFYKVGTNIGQVFKLICIAFCALVFVVSLTLRKVNAPENLTSQSTSVVFSSSLCGFVFLTVFGCGIYNMIAGRTTDIFTQIAILLCIPVAANFFLICAREQRKKNVSQTVIAMFPVIFYAVRIIGTFVDSTTQINSSQRSLKLVVMCAIMLMFLYEAEYMIPKNEQKQRSVAKHYAFCLFSYSFALISVVPYILACALWFYQTQFLLMDILDACVGVYALTRAVTLVKEK